MAAVAVTPVKAETLTPFHYHSLAVPSGTATLAAYLADRSMAYALAGAMGALAPSAALPQKDYLRDLLKLPWLCSVFEARNPRLLPPLGKRLNLDTEGGYQKRVIDATGTGNLKTWFFIQEVPVGVVYDGAIFGPNPFDMARDIEGRPVTQIVVRTGRHLGGLVMLTQQAKLEPEQKVRLNAHTAHVFGQHPEHDSKMEVDVFALYDLQLTQPIPLSAAADMVANWRHFEG